jgi:hypothetical protein
MDLGDDSLIGRLYLQALTAIPYVQANNTPRAVLPEIRILAFGLLQSSEFLQLVGRVQHACDRN